MLELCNLVCLYHKWLLNNAVDNALLLCCIINDHSNTFFMYKDIIWYYQDDTCRLYMYAPIQ